MPGVKKGAETYVVTEPNDEIYYLGTPLRDITCRLQDEERDFIILHQNNKEDGSGKTLIMRKSIIKAYGPL